MNSAIRCEKRDDGSIEIFVNDVVLGRYAGLKELAMHLGFCIAARDAIATAKEAEPKWYRAEEVSRDIHDGDMWWWDDEDGFVVPVNIGWCVQDEYFFACVVPPQKLTDMGGWWTPCIPPERKETSDHAAFDY